MLNALILDVMLIFLAIGIFLIGVLLSQDPAYSLREKLILIGLGTLTAMILLGITVVT